MCISFLNSYVCRIVTLGGSTDALPRIIKSSWHHPFAVTIGPVCFPRIGRSSHWIIHGAGARTIRALRIGPSCIYTFEPVHTCAYTVRRWLYEYATAYTHTRKSTCARTRCGNAYARPRTVADHHVPLMHPHA